VIISLVCIMKMYIKNNLLIRNWLFLRRSMHLIGLSVLIRRWCYCKLIMSVSIITPNSITSSDKKI